MIQEERMYTINWIDKKGAGCGLRTASAERALQKIMILFKGRIEARCIQDGHPDTVGAVWKSDRNHWNWFMDIGGERDDE